MGSWILMLALLSAPSSAEPAPGQVLLFQGARKTKVKLRFQPGDTVAYLDVRDPPAGLLKALRSEPGAVVREVERLSLSGRTLHLALHLRDADQRIRLLKRRKRRRWLFNLAFYPIEGPPVLKPARLLKEIAGVIPQPQPNTPFPSTPKTNPCETRRTAHALLDQMDGKEPLSARALRRAAGLVDAPRCRDFMMARAAIAADRAGQSLKPWSRWAFRISSVDRWDGYPLAYSYTAMIAAHILTRLDFLPEANVLLSVGRIIKSQRLLPYLAIESADLELAYKRYGQAEQILRSLLKARPSPELATAAYHRLALAALRDNKDAMAVVREAARRLDFDPRHAAFWNLAGELALGAGEREEARRMFALGRRSRLPTDRAVARLRLTDMALADGAPHKAALKAYGAIKTEDPCLRGLLKHRERTLLSRDQERLENAIEDALAAPKCPGERVELSYAAAQFALLHRDFKEALRLIVRARETQEGRWGSIGPLGALERMIAGQSIEQLSRNRAPARLVELHTRSLKRYDAQLPTHQLIDIADAYAEQGLFSEAAELLLSRLRAQPDSPLRDEMNVKLLSAYLSGEDSYRFETVERFFLAQRKRSPLLWEALQLQAEHALSKKDGKTALSALDAAEKRTPQGDPRTRAQLRRAEALYLLGRADPAALELISVLQSTWRPSLERRGVAVNVSSICARQCSPKVLDRLLQELRKYQGGALLNDRLGYLLRRRGALAPQAQGQPSADDKSTVWARLRAVAPELTRPSGEDKENK